MKIQWSILALLLLPISIFHGGSADLSLPHKVLFDFENDRDLAGWSSVELGGSKRKEPPVTLAVDEQNATSGRRSFSSHGPDGMTVERAENFGHSESQEIFMRHRCPLMRVDLSSIPKA